MDFLSMSSQPNDLYNELSEIYSEPTKEVLATKLSNDDLIRLCSRTNCRVEMYKWNVVQDFATVYTNEGRFDGKSKKFINKLLLKSYNRNKDLFYQTEREMAEEQQAEWRLRKKMSLARLNLWKYDEERENELEMIMDDIGGNDSGKIIYAAFADNESSLIVPAYSNEVRIVSTVSESVGENVGLNKELLQCNSESMTLGTQSLDLVPDSEKLTESMPPLTLSEIQETPMNDVMFQFEDGNYERFNGDIEVTSTQDFL